jgi:hypothetical protein
MNAMNGFDPTSGAERSTGVMGGVALVTGIAGLAVAPPLGMAVAVLGVTVVLVDGFILILEYGQSRLVPFFDQVLAAQERELRRPVGDHAIEDPGEQAACRTRRLLATLNHALRTRAPV